MEANFIFHFCVVPVAGLLRALRCDVKFEIIQTKAVSNPIILKYEAGFNSRCISDIDLIW